MDPRKLPHPSFTISCGFVLPVFLLLGFWVIPGSGIRLAGAAALDNNTFINCRCVQGSHYCPKGQNGCNSACVGTGKPEPNNYCISNKQQGGHGTGLLDVRQRAQKADGANGADVVQSSAGPNALIVRVSCTAVSPPSNNLTTGTNTSTGIHDRHQGLPHQFDQVWTTINATVPGGSRGQVYVPLLDRTRGSISESGVAVWREGAFLPTPATGGVKPGGYEGRFVWFGVNSGNYSFAASAA
jgi:hypothetical protein